MPLRKELVAAGNMLTDAIAVGGSTNIGITATGATNITAVQLAAATNLITTTAAGTGVMLQVCDQGDFITVVNYGANVLKVYPPIGWKVHGAAVDVGFSVGANKSAMFTLLTDPNRPLPQGGLAAHEFFAQLSA